MRRIATAGFLGTIILCASLGAVGQNLWHGDAPRAKVTLSTLKQIHVGGLLIVRVEIRNVGDKAFYVSSATENCDSHSGGFEAEVTPPPDAEVNGMAVSCDFAPIRRDILKEAETYILLSPGESYGDTFSTPVQPKSPGVYKILAKRIPPSVTEEERERLRANLKFPVLLEAVQSKVTSVVVVK